MRQRLWSTAAKICSGVRRVYALISYAGEIVGARRRARADLVVLLDDLELPNLDQAAVVVETVRQAVRAHIGQLGADPESFETSDPAYSNDDGSGCTALLARAQTDARRRHAWDVRPTAARMPAERRERHPKAYLQWLCRDPNNARNCSSYRETHEGAEALAGLSWTSVLANPSWFSAARALIGDLAELLGRPHVMIPAGPELPELSRGTRRNTRVLRNI